MKCVSMRELRARASSRAAHCAVCAHTGNVSLCDAGEGRSVLCKLGEMMTDQLLSL